MPIDLWVTFDPPRQIPGRVVNDTGFLITYRDWSWIATTLVGAVHVPLRSRAAHRAALVAARLAATPLARISGPVPPTWPTAYACQDAGDRALARPRCWLEGRLDCRADQARFWRRAPRRPDLRAAHPARATSTRHGRCRGLCGRLRARSRPSTRSASARTPRPTSSTWTPAEAAALVGSAHVGDRNCDEPARHDQPVGPVRDHLPISATMRACWSGRALRDWSPATDASYTARPKSKAGSSVEVAPARCRAGRSPRSRSRWPLRQERPTAACGPVRDDRRIDGHPRHPAGRTRPRDVRRRGTSACRAVRRRRPDAADGSAGGDCMCSIVASSC